MMEKKRYIEKQRNSRGIIAVFLGILIFLVFFFPFYGLSMRYYIGYGIRTLFNGIGSLSLMGGSFLLILSVISLFFGKKIRVGWLIVAVVLIWIGGWCTGTYINLFGFLVGNTQGSGAGTGYH